ncbi:hypothetical protein V8E36_004144 [Tilletia maclaganii]
MLVLSCIRSRTCSSMENKLARFSRFLPTRPSTRIHDRDQDNTRAHTMTTIFALLTAALGEEEHSAALSALIEALAPGADAHEILRSADRKQYPDVTYLNCLSLGISILLESVQSKPFKVAGIDIYNHAPEAAERKATKASYGPFPAYPIRIMNFEAKQGQAISLELTPATTGVDFVRAFGEPDRKGGGEGPTGRGPAAWLEWTGMYAKPTGAAGDGPAQTRISIMVELGGEGARGPRRWEAGNADLSVWKVLTIGIPQT